MDVPKSSASSFGHSDPDPSSVQPDSIMYISQWCLDVDEREKRSWGFD